MSTASSNSNISDSLRRFVGPPLYFDRKKIGRSAKPIQAIDYLNLRLGIVHGDICPWNLLVDPETDDLKVFDFNLGAKLGWEGDAAHENTFCYEEARNDVKLAIFTLYEIITRDLSFREENYPEELDVSMVVDKEDWEQHPDVRLEEGVVVSEYRQVLEDWVKARKAVDAELTHYKQVPDYIDWPPVPEFPLVNCAGTMMRRRAQMRQGMVRRGEPFIRWCATRVLFHFSKSMAANSDIRV